MKLIRCATTNAGKLREFRIAAVHFGFTNVGIGPLEQLSKLPECTEDGTTFEANAIKKALHYSVYSHQPVFADDSGLVVPALDNAPGVFSARFAGAGAADEDNNQLLLQRLAGKDDRTAHFVCAIALAHDGRLLGMFHGSVEGRIALSPAGKEGFGYDPLFYHEAFGCTFGEESAERKMEVSHRGQALKAMLSYVSANL